MMKVMPRRRCSSINSSCVLSRSFLSSAASGSSSSSILRPPRQRARQRHALLLAAGKLIRLALLHALELDQRHHLGDAGVDSGARQACAFQPERDVVPHVEMRKQRVVLEHHVDGPLMRQHRRDVAAVEQDAALVRRLETGEHPQQRGLAAAARPQQREELAGPDVERQPVHRAEIAERLGDALDAEQRHVVSRIGRRCGPRRRCRHIGLRCVDFRRFLGHATCQSHRGRTLAADRLPLNASQRASHNIVDATASRSGKVRSFRKARPCAARKFAEEH